MSDTTPDAPPPEEDHGAWRLLKIPAGQTEQQARIEQNLEVPAEEMPSA